MQYNSDIEILSLYKTCTINLFLRQKHKTLSSRLDVKFVILRLHFSRVTANKGIFNLSRNKMLHSYLF